MTISLETLPVELLADILSELDLQSLIIASGLSRRFRAVASDISLNPWRNPMIAGIKSGLPDPYLTNLSIRNIVPRQNWIEVLVRAPTDWILYKASLPNLKNEEWQECFSRRFLPGWKKWKKDESWRHPFLFTLSLASHRQKTHCTSDEAWTSYLVINRNGSANQLNTTSRNFNPITLFNEIKHQNDLFHLDTLVRVVVQLADVRILAFGVQHKPRKSFQNNPNAKSLLHPPKFLPKLRYPSPADTFANYPDHTPGGYDKRWITVSGLEEGGLNWVGSLMLVAQLIDPTNLAGPDKAEETLLLSSNHLHYASLTWPDLWALAPWMVDKIVKCIDGPGLGLD